MDTNLPLHAVGMGPHWWSYYTEILDVGDHWTQVSLNFKKVLSHPVLLNLYDHKQWDDWIDVGISWISMIKKRVRQVQVV